VFILGGTFVVVRPTWLSTTVIGLGVGLLATAVAGILTAWIIAPRSTDALEKMIARTIGAPVTLLQRRALLAETYLQMMKEATHIDIVAMTLKAFFVSCSNQDIVKCIEQGKHFRIMLLFPDACVTQIRQREEPASNLAADVAVSTRKVQEIFNVWEQSRRQWQGSFEVRFYDTLPYHAYFRADDRFIVGFYYHSTVGHQSECILVRENAILEQGIAANLKDHFSALWRDSEPNTLCRLDRRQGFFRPEVQGNATASRSGLMTGTGS
jgi:hypothetical protein